MDFEAYLEELADPSQQLAVSHLVRLSNLGAEEASLLLNAWQEMTVERRRRVIQTLGELAEDNVELNFDVVFSLALADSDAEVRLNAIRGLWECEGRHLIDPLIGLLQGDGDPAVRAEAALALGRYVVQAEFDTLRPADAERVERALRRAVGDPKEVSEVRGRALEALGARSAPWVRALIEEAFRGTDRRLHLSALHAMGRSCDPSWLSRLVPELESDDPEARFEAAGALGGIGDERAIPYLLPLLYDDDAEVQEAAIGALGEIGGAQARRALRDRLEDGDQRLRAAVLDALAAIDFANDPLAFTLRG